MSTRDDLLKAADYIEKHGWTQGDYVNATGEVCAIGAIQAVCDRDGSRRIAAKVALRNYLPDPIVSIPFWNDADDRTQDEVVAAFRAAAEATP